VTFSVDTVTLALGRQTVPLWGFSQLSFGLYHSEVPP
jgi:hypothetical protein